MTTKIKKAKNNSWTNRAKQAAGEPVTKRAEKKYERPGRPKKNPTLTVSVRVQWQNYDRLKSIVKAADKLAGADFSLLQLFQNIILMSEKEATTECVDYLNTIVDTYITARLQTDRGE